MKTCYKCKRELSLSQFHLDASRAGGLSNKCKTCAASIRRVQRYGSDLTERKCEACGTHKNLVVDHCHETLKVRGTLCSNCNTALGLLNEDVNRMQLLIQYTKNKCK